MKDVQEAERYGICPPGYEWVSPHSRKHLEAKGHVNGYCRKKREMGVSAELKIKELINEHNNRTSYLVEGVVKKKYGKPKRRKIHYEVPQGVGDKLLGEK